MNLVRLLASPHVFCAVCEFAANIEVPVDFLQCIAKRHNVVPVLASDTKVEFFPRNVFVLGPAADHAQSAQCAAVTAQFESSKS
jgi:hypothetical protein